MNNLERHDSSPTRLGSYSGDEVKSKWPTLTDFEAVFGVQSLKKAVNKASFAAYIANPVAPRLQDIGMAYGEQSTKNYLRVLLLQTFGLYETDEKQDAVLSLMTDILYERFSCEKISVLIYFLGQCMAGEYKTKYGQIEIQPILESATQYINALPRLKDTARAEIVAPTDGEKKIITYSYSYFDSIHSRNLWDAWRDSVLDLWRVKGIKAIKNALETCNEYSCAIQGLIYIKALYLDSYGRQHYSYENYERHVCTLNFDPDGYRARGVKYYSF